MPKDITQFTNNNNSTGDLYVDAIISIRILEAQNRKLVHLLEDEVRTKVLHKLEHKVSTRNKEIKDLKKEKQSSNCQTKKSKVMKTLIFIMLLISCANIKAQEFTNDGYGNFYLIKGDLKSSQLRNFKNVVMYVEGNIIIDDPIAFRMTQASRIYYTGFSEINHPRIIKIRNTRTKVGRVPILSKYEGADIELIKNGKVIYRSNHTLADKHKITNGYYDVKVSGKTNTYLSNIIIN